MLSIKKINWRGVGIILFNIGYFLLFFGAFTNVFGTAYKKYFLILWLIITVFLVYKSIPFIKFLKKTIEINTWGKPLNEMTKDEAKKLTIFGFKKDKK